MSVNLKDRKAKLIVGGIVVGLGVLIYFLFKNKPLGVELINIDNNSINPNKNNQSTQSNLNFDLVLKKGSEGDEVKELQRILIENFGQDLGGYGENKDGIDGKFGNATLVGLLKAKQVSEIALKDF